MIIKNIDVYFKSKFFNFAFLNKDDTLIKFIFRMEKTFSWTITKIQITLVRTITFQSDPTTPSSVTHH